MSHGVKSNNLFREYPTSEQKYTRRYSRYIGHQSFPKVHGHAIADTGWHNREPAKHFLPLAKEAKRIAKEIRIKKINEQWAGIP